MVSSGRLSVTSACHKASTATRHCTPTLTPAAQCAQAFSHCLLKKPKPRPQLISMAPSQLGKGTSEQPGEAPGALISSPGARLPADRSRLHGRRAAFPAGQGPATWEPLARKLTSARTRPPSLPAAWAEGSRSGPAGSRRAAGPGIRGPVPKPALQEQACSDPAPRTAGSALVSPFPSLRRVKGRRPPGPLAAPRGAPALLKGQSLTALPSRKCECVSCLLIFLMASASPLGPRGRSRAQDLCL